MATVQGAPVSKTHPGAWLEDGQRMDAATFVDRYERMPPGFKAELIGGIVQIMPPMLSNDHGRSDFNSIGWLFLYHLRTPGTVGQNNTTTILGDANVPQPDSALLIRPEYGGQTGVGGPGGKYTAGAPELVIEVAGSSLAEDLGAKLEEYEKAGVREYLVLDAGRGAVRWFVHQEGKFAPLERDQDGIFRSQTFPGLWLDAEALARDDMAEVIRVLNLGIASPEHAVFVAELERRRATSMTPPPAA